MRRTKTRALSLLLALVMVLGLLPGTAWAEEEDVIEIETAEELGAFRDRVNGGENTLCAELTADIELEEEWMPIWPASGYITEAYAGTFNGNGHTISGLSINATAANQGLFGAINGATIKNLRVEGDVYSSKAYVGGIIGKVQHGTVENCSFSGTVGTGATGSTAYAGGITGYAGNTATQTATIFGCANMGGVTGGVSGGIAGYAKFSVIENCYNTGAINGLSRSGGIAGQLQNNGIISNCYNTGEITGSTTANDICDFVYSTANVESCYGKETPPEDILSKLGFPFVADEHNINGGYPILSWQVGAEPNPKDPHIEIRGSAVLYDTNSNSKPQTALTVNYVDMDDRPAVEWSIKGSSDIIRLETPADASEDNSTTIVKAVKSGKATVTATAGDYTAKQEITVWPFVTTVEIEGTVAVGETVKVKINVLGGGELDYDTFPVNITWRYKETAYDTSFQNISGSSGHEFKITEDYFEKYLSFAFLYNGEGKLPSSPTKVKSAAEAVLEKDAAALDIGTASIKEAKTLTLPVSGANGSDITWESENEAVINPNTGAVTLPDAGIESVMLTATLRYQGKERTRAFSFNVYSLIEAAAPNARVSEAAAKLGAMYPVSGTDTNVGTMAQTVLNEKGYSDVTAAVKSVSEVYGNANIDGNGNITYFYVDPNTTPSIKFGSYQVTFTLTKDGESLEKEIPIIIYWDTTKVKAVMTSEILDKVALDTSAPVTGDLSLPKVADGKKWTLISWQSSNPDAISISDQNQGAADTLFDPYVGVVKPSETAQEVTLTATFTFQLTNDVTGNEKPITMSKVFTVTIPSMDKAAADKIRKDLLDKLDKGFSAKGLTDAATGERLTPDEENFYTVFHDIQFPTTRDLGVDGKFEPVIITTDNSEALIAPDVHNAARVEVFRPAAGQPDAEGTVSVTLRDNGTGVTASKTFKIKVKALTREEIAAELALMERVKISYFDGIKGGNPSRNDVRTDLSPFFEVYADESGELVWVRSNAERTGYGIVPVPIEGWEDLETWRLFKSSNPNVISHENLLVTQPERAKAVTVTSWLSSEALGRYGELYERDPETYAQYAALAPLYAQKVSTDAVAQPEVQTSALYAQAQPDKIIVRGTADPGSAIPVAESLNVTFALTGLDGQKWIAPISFSGLDETLSVYDVFVKALGSGYTVTREKGTYIKAITGPQGTLEEKQHGENSGWMYWVNGILPDVYMGVCPLHNGDSIHVFYTRDGSSDAPNWSRPSSAPSSSGGGSTGGNAASASAVQIKKDEKAGTYTITLNQSNGTPQIVTIPNVGEEQIALIVHPGGREEPVKKSVLTGGGLKLQLRDSATIRLVDHSSQFSDVEHDAWYSSAVDFVSGRGLFSGVGSGRFAPELPLSRGMLATVLRELEGPAPQTVQNLFSDVADSAWYTQGIAWAERTGIVSGYGDGRFGPDDNITREQLAVMLFRYAGILNMSTSGRDSLSGFSDSGAVSDWARDAVAWAVDSGIISGLPDGRLDPSGTASRAEAAAMLQKFIAVLLK